MSLAELAIHLHHLELVKAATHIGEKDAADFSVSEEKSMADVDTLDRA